MSSAATDLEAARQVLPIDCLHAGRVTVVVVMVEVARIPSVLVVVVVMVVSCRGGISMRAGV